MIAVVDVTADRVGPFISAGVYVRACSSSNLSNLPSHLRRLLDDVYRVISSPALVVFFAPASGKLFLADHRQRSNV